MQVLVQLILFRPQVHNQSDTIHIHFQRSWNNTGSIQKQIPKYFSAAHIKREECFARKKPAKRRTLKGKYGKGRCAKEVDKFT
jgi:hypothetical protein